jgi:hypothetical protein
MKKTVMVLMAVLVIAGFQLQTAFSGQLSEEAKLTGTWTTTSCSTDSSGNPCPYLPDSMEFFKDKTMTMSNLGTKHFPFKTTLTKEEKLAIEKRDPDTKGKNLLLIKNRPDINWVDTRMMYVYSVDKNELTLTLKGWKPATFARIAN